MTLSEIVEITRAEALPDHGPRRRLRVRAGSHEDATHDERIAGQARPSAGRRRAGLPRELVGITVVIVDDDELTLEYFGAALRACGATVVTVATAADGLRIIRERRPDVVISDIAMAGNDGYWLVRELRRSGESGLDRLPVVAATAYGIEHSRDRTLSAGFTDHLRKPVEPEVLCRTVARAAGR